jgi:type II secretory pathway pseudopilin PulG
MTDLSDQRGFMLVELLVAIVITSIVMGAIVAILTIVLNDNRYYAFRDEAQANAQTMVDRLSRELRSSASPSAGSSGLLQKAASYDLVFQAINAAPGQAPTGNPSNHIWVRYCLDGSETLWRQSTTPASTTSSLPDTSACPSTSSSWITSSGGQPCCQELNDVTNEIGGDNRWVFTYLPSGSTSTSQINGLQVSLYVDKNPGHRPGPTQLTSGIYLRNGLTPPVASFAATKTPNQAGTDIYLNGSASSDPNGQALSYQWYNTGPCPSSGAPAGAISGATTQEYDAGNFSAGSSTFSLVVTDTGGLANCSSQAVTTP